MYVLWINVVELQLLTTNSSQYSSEMISQKICFISQASLALKNPKFQFWDTILFDWKQVALAFLMVENLPSSILFIKISNEFRIIRLLTWIYKFFWMAN